MGRQLSRWSTLDCERGRAAGRAIDTRLSILRCPLCHRDSSHFYFFTLKWWETEGNSVANPHWLPSNKVGAKNKITWEKRHVLRIVLYQTSIKSTLSGLPIILKDERKHIESLFFRYIACKHRDMMADGTDLISDDVRPTEHSSGRNWFLIDPKRDLRQYYGHYARNVRLNHEEAHLPLQVEINRHDYVFTCQEKEREHWGARQQFLQPRAPAGR